MDPTIIVAGCLVTGMLLMLVAIGMGYAARAMQAASDEKLWEDQVKDEVQARNKYQKLAEARLEDLELLVKEIQSSPGGSPGLERSKLLLRKLPGLAGPSDSTD